MPSNIIAFPTKSPSEPSLPTNQDTLGLPDTLSPTKWCIVYCDPTSDQIRNNIESLWIFESPEELEAECYMMAMAAGWGVGLMMYQMTDSDEFHLVYSVPQPSETQTRVFDPNL